jgi:hypothetical protein
VEALKTYVDHMSFPALGPTNLHFLNLYSRAADAIKAAVEA